MSSTGYIDAQGHYIRGDDKPMGYDINPTHKEWRHDLERKIYSKDIIQPYKNGKPNKEFIDNYPEESKEYFTPDTIEKLRREL